MTRPRRRRRPGPRPTTGRGDSLVGTEWELLVGPVAHGGHCVARHEGRVVFVRHTLPGERVRAVVTEGAAGDRFLRADAVEIIEAAPQRVTPPCRHAGPGGCGGCDWQHVDLPGQRRLKAAVVAEQLRRLAGLDRVEVLVEPVPGDRDGLGWRTRVEFAVGRDGRAGLRRHRSHDVVALGECRIAVDAVLDTGVLQRDWSGSRAVEVIAPTVGEPVVIPVPVAADPVVVHERVVTPCWTGEFAVPARAFWQVHPGAAATLLTRVLGELAARPGEHVLDLYAGTGLFAVPLSDLVGPTGSVVAVEADSRAAVHAVANAAGRDWLQVVTADVAAYLGEPAADPATEPAAQPATGVGTIGRVDLVVLDPPRTGAGRQVVEAVCARRPRAVVYVACDPAALARDLGYAAAAGYRLGALAAYDLFPMTHHVECVATLLPDGDASPRERLAPGQPAVVDLS